MTLTDLYAILPILSLVAWALVLMLVDLWIPRGHKGIIALLSALGLVVSLVCTVLLAGQKLTAFNGMVAVDGFALALDVLFIVSGLAAIALAYNWLKRTGLERAEYYTLLLFSISGMMLMAHAYDLIIVFLALELLSIPLYILAGFYRDRAESEEASLKYFLLGAFAGGFVLYGLSMVFGATARTDLPGIFAVMQSGKGNPVLLLVGAALILVGLGFKVAAFPFHKWVPDVYQGAPSPVTAFMSVAVKAAGFAALLRVFVTTFAVLAPQLAPVVWVISALTMVAGNVLAIAQTNIKRLLAYSSISNAGYLLMAFVTIGNPQVVSDSVASMLFFLVAYGFTSLGAWAVVVALEQAEGKGLELNDLAGLGKKYPWLALAMLAFMLSFTGVPVTLGFWGKFYLFRTAVLGGEVALALIGLLTSLISAYYYLRVVVIMYMRPGEPLLQSDRWARLTAVVMALVVVVLAFVPSLLLDAVTRAGLLIK